MVKCRWWMCGYSLWILFTLPARSIGKGQQVKVLVLHGKNLPDFLEGWVKLKGFKGRDERINYKKCYTLYTFTTKIYILLGSKIRKCCCAGKGLSWNINCSPKNSGPAGALTGELQCHWARSSPTFPVLYALLQFHWALEPCKIWNSGTQPLLPQHTSCLSLERWLWAKGIVRLENWGRSEGAGSHTKER